MGGIGKLLLFLLFDPEVKISAIKGDALASDSQFGDVGSDAVIEGPA